MALIMSKKFNRPYSGHKSYESAFNGVALYIQGNFKNLLTGNNNRVFSEVNEVMRNYLKEKGLKAKENNKSSSMDFNANVIQNDWKSFKNWLKEQN